MGVVEDGDAKNRSWFNRAASWIQCHGPSRLCYYGGAAMGSKIGKTPDWDAGVVLRVYLWLCWLHRAVSTQLA
jgi:hypothetical protein